MRVICQSPGPLSSCTDSYDINWQICPQQKVTNTNDTFSLITTISSY